MPESTLLPDVLHLVAFGQLGVLVRYWLGYAFGGGCTAGSSWLPCVTSPGLIRTGGALFTDLPANIVGSAVMGFLSPADLLLLGQAQPQCPQPKAQQGTQPDATTQRSPAIQPGTPCAALPTGSVLQKHSPLLLGLRTGFCGCCTTFASWLTQVTYMMVGRAPGTSARGTEWFDAICALIIGCLASQAALVTGQQAARMVSGYWARHTDPTPTRTNTSSSLSSTDVTLTTNPLAVQMQQQHASSTNGNSTNAIAVQAAQVVGGNGHTVAMKADNEPSVAPPTRAPATAPTMGSMSVEQDGGRTLGLTITRVCDLIALTILFVLTGVSVGFVAYVSSNAETVAEKQRLVGGREYVLWVSMLLSPVGCLLRWRLSVLNQRPAATSPLPWFPLGTWLANIGGCLLDYAVAVILLRTTDISHFSRDVLAAVIAGAGGSLSTVSTWVVELQKLGVNVTDDNRALIYLIATLVPAVALGLLVYGTAAWTL